MNVTVTLPGADADELRSLYRDLSHEFDLRGRITFQESATPSGHLGGIADVLVVTLGSSGAGVTLASATVAWVRNRASDVVCKLTREDGSTAELSAKRIRNCDTATLQQLVLDLSATFNTGSAPPEHSAASQTDSGS